MKNFGLKTRLIVGIAFLTLVLIILGAVGYNSTRIGNQAVKALLDEELRPNTDLAAISDVFAHGFVETAHQTLIGRLTWAQARTNLKDGQAEIARYWNNYNAVGSLGENERKTAAEIDQLITGAKPALQTLGSIFEKEDAVQLTAFNKDVLYQVFDPITQKLHAATIDHLNDAKKRGDNAVKRFDAMEWVLFASTLLGVLISALIGYYLARMAGDLVKLVSQVQKSGVQVSSSVTEIAATSKQQQATASEIAATTTEIGATSKEISATSRELVKTMSDVTRVSEETAALAGHGQEGLTRMGQTMGQLTEAVGSITSKLAVLNEKAGNINQVVTTITKVADQTNLLSLNAAIEAEKAGEYGRGFSVVATEIRRLADQSAVATLDIEQMVKEMQSAVSAGVMGMDKFSEEVRRGVGEVQQVGNQLTQIIDQVQALSPRFETVNEGMQSQAVGGQQISEALTQLSESAQQTAESLKQSNQAIEQLNEASRGLRQGVELIRL